MSDLLIAAAVDFGAGGAAEQLAEPIGEALRLGKAGDVRWWTGAQASLLARVRQVKARPSIRRASFVPSADGGFTLLAGRLFEREALTAALGQTKPPPDDAALYAAAHMQWGATCDQRLVGDYASIRWFPEQRRLRIARSATSRHPIHLWRRGNLLIAASLPRALFAAGAPNTIDPAALDEFLLHTGPAAARSFYAECSRVPVATVCDVDPDTLRLTEFWAIADVPAVRYRRDEEYVAAVDAAFTRALSAYCADVKQPAVSLSGGLDSQAVAAYALDALPAGQVLPTFTATPMPGWEPAPRPARFGDESAHVRAFAAQHPRIDAHFTTAAEAGFGDGLDTRTALSSWPSFNEINAHWGGAIADAAARRGCDAVFSGDLGNLGFSYDGRTGFASWLVQGNWVRLMREVVHSGDPRSLPRALFSRAVWPHVPNRIRLRRDRANPWMKSPFATWSPLREDRAATSGVLDRARAQGLDVDGYDPASARRSRDQLWRWYMAHTPEIALGHTLAHGIELADPTAFVPLLELCAGIPDAQYLRDGTERWLARRLLAGKVPDFVRAEERTGAQSADWPLRIARERPALIAELDRMAGDRRLAEVFDFARMRRDLAEWDGTDDASASNFQRIALCATRGIAAARFVRFIEGRNV